MQILSLSARENYSSILQHMDHFLVKWNLKIWLILKLKLQNYIFTYCIFYIFTYCIFYILTYCIFYICTYCFLHIASSGRKICFHEKFYVLRFPCQDTQNDVKSPEKWFRKNVRMDVCMCVWGETSESLSFCISGITWSIELKFSLYLKQTRPFL